MRILLLLLFGFEVISFVPTRAQNDRQYVVRDGDEVEIKCSPGNISGSFIKWDVPDVLTNLTISRNSSLNVKNPRTSSLQGLFNVSCLVSGSVNGSNQTNGTTTERILYQVVLYKAPKITTEAFDVTLISIKEGDPHRDVIFPCKTIGYPRPFINWVFGEVTLNFTSGGISGPIIFDHNLNRVTTMFQVFKNGTLRISNANYKESVPYNNFTCVASSFIGVDRVSHVFSIGTVEIYLFEIFLVNASQYGTQRKDIVKKIESVFENSLSLRSINVTHVNLTSGKVDIVLTWLTKTLEDKKYLEKEGNDYLLKSHELASDVRKRLVDNGVAIAKFIMDAKPGPAIDLTVNDVSETTVSFSWKNPENFIIDEYQIQFTEGGSEWKNSDKIPGSKKSTVLDGLEEGTKYLIRLQSINKNGVGDYESKPVEANTDGKRLYVIRDGGDVEIKCSPSSSNFSNITWDVPDEFPNFNVTRNSSLIVTNPRTSSLQGLFNVSCLASGRNNGSNQTNGTTTTERILYQIVLYKAPKITTEAFDVTLISIKEGDPHRDVIFPCKTIGYPRPFINWVFGEVTLNFTSGGISGPTTLIHNFNKVTTFFRVFKNGTLRINNANYENSVPYNNFTCVASSFIGVDRVSHVFLIGTVEIYLFEIFLVNASQYGTQRKDIVKKIESVFENSLSLRSINVTHVNLTSGRVDIVLTWLTKTLEDKKYLEKKGNDYLLKSHELASDVRKRLVDNGVAIAKFIMDAKPGPATDLTVNEELETTVSFSWKNPENFIIDEYQIQFTEGGSEWKNSDKIPGSKKSTVLDGLEEGTKYLIRLQSINKKGVGDYESKPVVATTKDTVPVTIIVVVVVLVVVVVIALIVAFVYYRKRLKDAPIVEIIPLQNEPYMFSLPGVHTTNIYERDHRTFCPYGGSAFQGAAEPSEKEYFSWREIPRESLDMKNELGQGEFGMVMKAIWTDQENNAPLPVAVKTIKDTATENDRKELFKELRLMSEISDHPNIVKMIGACSKGGPLWIVVELCEHGNLLSFLRKNRKEILERQGDYISSLDPLLRVRIGYDVSKGMRYLEDKKIVHRDLAARNVLLGKNKVAKIADFGLSRDIYDEGTYEKKTGGKLPIKWMAIESLTDQTYDSKSDVWSFGILLWEIETAGRAPYPGIPGRDISHHLLNGFRMDKPDETPFEIFDIMKKCWEASPKLRPHFAEIETKLEAYLEERSDYLPVLIEDDTAEDAEEAYYNYIVGNEEEEDSTL
ncbi:uncharacterized protein LOC114526994 [Dendronephthya gigantea]|uniref:uncharacterized protein LOC114526994 n=1 Tax=Dendronephthya gigantea TaxID=151771 RepID=UPI00106C6E30|nr:uncharacterized protein LOC114526994 [Dendronephthya gigantea]